MCCYSVPVRRKGVPVSRPNLHPDYLLVKRWAILLEDEGTPLTLDEFHEGMGSRAFADACEIVETMPVGKVEEIRVDLAVHRAPLVVIAESRGWTLDKFLRSHFLWLKEFYCLTADDAPEEQEGWIEGTPYTLCEFAKATTEEQDAIITDRLYDQAHA